MDDYREYLLQPLANLIRIFSELQIPYALMGGMAVSVHGIPRPTHDLDFTISIERQRLPELYASAERLGVSDRLDEALKLYDELILVTTIQASSTS